jgi:hypothetical protein
MKHRDLVSEHAAKATDGLRCEADLGNEDDGAPTRVERLSHGLQIDKRFSTPGHSEQQGSLSRSHCGNSGQSRGLVCRQRWWWRGCGGTRKGIAQHFRAAQPSQTFAYERLDHALTEAQVVG